MESALGRRLTAEFIGTALLVLFGTGSVVAVLTVGNGQLDYAALGYVGLAVGIVAAAVIYGFGAVSGAHINPAVTFALGVTGLRTSAVPDPPGSAPSSATCRALAPRPSARSCRCS